MRYFAQRLNEAAGVKVSGSEVVYAGNPELGAAIEKIVKREYRQRAHISVGAAPYFEMFAEEVKAREGASCVVNDGARVFDPRDIANWQRVDLGNTSNAFRYQRGDVVSVHLRNLNGTKYSLKGFVNLIGADVGHVAPEKPFAPSHRCIEEIVRDAAMANGISVVVGCEYGLHARPASMFVKLASNFDCDVYVQSGNKKVSGKSIMGMITLEVVKGAIINLSAEGDDASECLKALKELVESEEFKSMKC